MRQAWRRAWPWPAVVVWAVAGLVWRAGPGDASARMLLALAVSLGGALSLADPWRRWLVTSGFPMAAVLTGATPNWSPWWWLLALLPLLLLYPLRAWRDAPFFPTPPDALQGLAAVVGSPRRVLDAGCGLGDGLLALRRLWPRAELQGVEWSGVLCALARVRARRCGARVWRGDMWAQRWAGQDLVYLFQRPESMARAYEKACRELEPGAWLVSLEFAVPGVPPVACLQAEGQRPVWVYQPAGGAAAARPAAGGAASIQG